MNLVKLSLCTAAIFSINQAALAEDPPASPAATAQIHAGVGTAENPYGPFDRVMLPEKFHLKDVALKDAIQLLHDQMGLNAVVIPGQGVDPNYPTLPEMTLDHVSVAQFLQLVEIACPGIKITVINGMPPKGDLIAISVPTQEGPVVGQSTRNAVVQVFHLDAIIGKMSGNGTPDDLHKAFNDLGTVITQTLAEVPGDEKADVKFHEPTQTLIFKGNPMQAATLTELLNSLTPKDDPEHQQMVQDASELSRLKDQYQDLAVKNSHSEDAIETLQGRLQDLQRENFELKYKLDHATPTTQPH